MYNYNYKTEINLTLSIHFVYLTQMEVNLTSKTLATLSLQMTQVDAFFKDLLISTETSETHPIYGVK